MTDPRWSQDNIRKAAAVLARPSISTASYLGGGIACISRGHAHAHGQGQSQGRGFGGGLMAMGMVMATRAGIGWIL